MHSRRRRRWRSSSRRLRAGRRDSRRTGRPRRSTRGAPAAAAGERSVNSAAPASAFGGRFNRDGEGASAQWRSRGWVVRLQLRGHRSREGLACTRQGRWRDCHFADVPSPSTLTRLLNGEGRGAAGWQSRRRLDVNGYLRGLEVQLLERIRPYRPRLVRFIQAHSEVIRAIMLDCSPYLGHRSSPAPARAR